MAELLSIGQKVEYLHKGEWLKGVIHGVKTHETNEGQITRIAYLIDTGETIREDNGAEPTGKMITHPDGGEYPEMKPVKVRQPEQIELDQQLVKAS
jgi:hypothetical protein